MLERPRAVKWATPLLTFTRLPALFINGAVNVFYDPSVAGDGFGASGATTGEQGYPGKARFTTSIALAVELL